MRFCLASRKKVTFSDLAILAVFVSILRCLARVFLRFCKNTKSKIYQKYPQVFINKNLRKSRKHAKICIFCEKSHESMHFWEKSRFLHFFEKSSIKRALWKPRAKCQKCSKSCIFVKKVSFFASFAKKCDFCEISYFLLRKNK